jgi:hypothetical protein
VTTINDSEFAYRVRQALDESTSRLDAATQRRLHEARQKALLRLNPTPGRAHALAFGRVLAAAGPSLAPEETSLGHWLNRLGIAAPLLALVIGIVGIKEWQNDRVVTEMADMDFAVLLDDTPIDMLAHQGFGVYLHKQDDTL